MTKEILISKDVDKTRVAMIENGVLDDFHVDSRPQTTHYSKSNNTLQYCEYGSAYP